MRGGSWDLEVRIEVLLATIGHVLIGYREDPLRELLRSIC